MIQQWLLKKTASEYSFINENKINSSTKRTISEDVTLCLTCSIGAILLMVRAILHWIRPERALLLLTSTSVSF